MANRIRVDLRIVNFPVDPSEITRDSGIVPTRTWLKGELINPKAIVKHKGNGWELSSGISQSAEFADHVEALVKLIQPHSEELRKICSQYYAELSCALYMHLNESTPWIHFNRPTLELFAYIGVEVDFDTYIFDASS